MLRRYRLILFDCFNTLVLSDPLSLPKLEIDGKQVTTTAGLLHEALSERHPGLEAGQIHAALRKSWKWAGDLRGQETREISAPERMRYMLQQLGLQAPDEASIEALVWVHMNALLASFVFPSEHMTLLEDIRAQYRMAIFSNFDYAPGLLRLLKQHGIEEWFDPIIISDTLGYRKPGGVAFDKAIALTGQRREDILFVGDSLTDDVHGAFNAEIDVAWINLNNESPQWDGAEPTIILHRLTDLSGVLLTA